MAEIDMYPHKCIGIVSCPSSYEIVPGRPENKNIALYRLGQCASEWNAKEGDLLLGGGSGECGVLRISIPEAIYRLTIDCWDKFESPDEIYKAYWSMTEAFEFGDGYAKIGWLPTESIELWLTEHIVAFVLQEYAENYRHFSGSRKLEKDGGICRLPNLASIEGSL